MKLLDLRTRKSAGVRVTARVHRILLGGNAARDRRDWTAAAMAYRRALEDDPGLAHIWVQLGHALKEQRLTSEARSAYLRAAKLRSADADPHLHLGHLFNQAGDHANAGKHYLKAFQADPGHADAATALHRALALANGRSRARLVEVMRSALGDAADTLAEPAPARRGTPGPASLTFDASDLVGYFTHGRLPTGIQRVQIQVIGSALQQPGRDVRVCCFIDGRDDWLEIPAATFLNIADLSIQSGDRQDPAWIIALHRLHLRLSLAEPYVFPLGSTLVNLGASWQLHNYFLFVRAAKARHAVRYVPFIHDLIPVVAPEHFTRSARLEVVPWIVGVFDLADQFLVNSESTRRDLLRTGAALGHHLDPTDIAVIRLDADFRAPGRATLPHSALAKWRLEQEPFVLFVSTVESRKGHAVALEAWSALIKRHAAAAVPKLVCVGKRGWLSQAVYERLDEDEAVAARVSMLSGVSDEELALLYRSCLFTIYPSLYEGWGMPITEAFCYGKPVIASDTASLPEAGGAHAVYVPPGSAPALAASVERMAFDAPYRDALAARIAAEARTRSWAEIAAEIEAEIVRLASRHPEPRKVPLPLARLGAYHSIARRTSAGIWPGAGSGEVFRVGVGWRSPGFDASWTRPQGGELSIGLPDGCGPLRLGLLLVGSPERDLEWRLQVRHGPGRVGTLARDGRQWITLTVASEDSPLPGSAARAVLRLRLRAEPADPHPERPDENEASIGLAGFFLYPEGDVAAAMRMLEAITLNSLDEVEAYRDTAAAGDEVDLWAD